MYLEIEDQIIIVLYPQIKVIKYTNHLVKTKAQIEIEAIVKIEMYIKILPKYLKWEMN